MPRPGHYRHTIALIAAIVLGGLSGSIFPAVGAWSSDFLDYTILLLITLLISEVPFAHLKLMRQDWRTLWTLWIVNFLIIPPLGYGLASVFLRGHELAMIGLIIYFMSPCTDWFLGFTRLAKGNMGLGTLFIPISMATQLALYPLYIWLFTPQSVSSQIGEVGGTIVGWFLIPLAIAIALRTALHFTPVTVAASARQTTSKVTTAIIVLLVFQIFAINIDTIVVQATIFPRALAAVLSFFVITWFLAELISQHLELSYENHALLSVTIAARNAPLMLAITTKALPDQPIIYAAIVIGMVLEFPHLTMLTTLLVRRNATPLERVPKVRPDDASPGCGEPEVSRPSRDGLTRAMLRHRPCQADT